MNLKKYDNRKDFLEDSTQFIIEAVLEQQSNHQNIGKNNDRQPRFLIGLSGGKTPLPVYKRLAKEPVKLLKSMEFFLLDERYVNISDSLSNYRAVFEQSINPFYFHYFQTHLSIDECLTKYSGELSAAFQAPHTFDLAILGIGLDGHFASVFPGQTKFAMTQLTAHTDTTSFAVYDRLTVTPDVILRSKKILILLSGKDKLPILEKITQAYDYHLNHKKVFSSEETDDCPALMLLSHPYISIFFLE